MAIDKPAGMIVHGDGTGERTLTDYASDLLLAMGDGFAATDMQPLNRLDRDTTGVVLFSLDKQTQPAFDQMIIDHAFESTTWRSPRARSTGTKSSSTSPSPATATIAARCASAPAASRLKLA